jgi:hypothetical protein
MLQLVPAKFHRTLSPRKRSLLALDEPTGMSGFASLLRVKADIGQTRRRQTRFIIALKRSPSVFIQERMRIFAAASAAS